MIIVSEEIYDHYLNAYLERLDVKRTTWTEFMQAAKNVQSGMEEWKRYCEVIDRFQADLDPWLQRKESGVRIYPRTD